MKVFTFLLWSAVFFFSSNIAVCHIKTVHCCVYLMLYCINMYNHLIYLNQMLCKLDCTVATSFLFNTSKQFYLLCYIYQNMNFKIIYKVSNIWIVFMICILLCSLYCSFIDMVYVSLSIIKWSLTFSSI